MSSPEKIPLKSITAGTYSALWETLRVRDDPRKRNSQILLAAGTQRVQRLLRIMTRMPIKKNPNVFLPVLRVAFEEIRMDMVGPLEKREARYQYILMIMDYAMWC